MNILLVDDEPFILRTLKEMIGSAKESWHIAGAVEDGEEAVAILEQIEVDLIISDIRMPAVDGIELVKYVHTKFPHIKVILLTGYKEFEYAQQAIRYGVVDYIAKPSSFEALFKSTEKVEKEIVQGKISSNLNQRRERDVLEKRLDDLLFGIPYPYYDTALFPSFAEILVFSVSIVDNAFPPGWKESTAYTALKNVAEEWFKEYGNTFAIIQDQHMAGIVFLKNQSNSLVIKDMIVSFRNTVQQVLKLDLCIGAGSPCGELDSLNVHYRESIQALESARQNPRDYTGIYGGVQNESMRAPLVEIYEVKKNRRMIELIIEKVKSRLSEDLSLKQLANEVYLNPTYLGRVFKQATGYCFSNYLTRLRMEKAKQMLADPSVKVYQVCEKIGYGDPAHFTHVFKKTFGMTPQKYKMRS